MGRGDAVLSASVVIFIFSRLHEFNFSLVLPVCLRRNHRGQKFVADYYGAISFFTMVVLVKQQLLVLYLNLAVLM